MAVNEQPIGQSKPYAVWTIFAIIAIAALYYFVNTMSNSQSGQVTVNPVPTQGAVQDVDELKIEDLTVGTGTEAVVGRAVTVDYKGTFLDGKEFDSSYGKGQPFKFVLGQGFVIQGWEQGLVGMKVGGKRKLTIPSKLGYGPQGRGSIPGGAALVFEIELHKVE